jgi:hypothetical protein
MNKVKGEEVINGECGLDCEREDLFQLLSYSCCRRLNLENLLRIFLETILSHVFALLQGDPSYIFLNNLPVLK